MRTRRYQTVDSTRLVRALWPPGARLLTAQVMLSAVADRLGLRDGVLVADRMSGGGMTGPYHVPIGLICCGSQEETVQRLTRRAGALGYELGRHPGTGWKPEGIGTMCRFIRDEALPEPEFGTVAPGGSVYGIVVPEGATGVLADVGIGVTMTDGHRILGTLNEATVARMAELGVDVDAGRPGWWQRFWCWWWIRAWRRRKLAWAAWRLRAYRGRVVGNWFVGGDAVGPYSFGIATVGRGDGRQRVERIAARAGTLGYVLGRGLGEQPEHLGTARARRGTVVVNAISYGPGAKVTASAGESVPEGCSAVIVTVTGRGW